MSVSFGLPLQAVEKIDNRMFRPLKGPNFEELTASLKRCPHTKPQGLRRALRACPILQAAIRPFCYSNQQVTNVPESKALCLRGEGFGWLASLTACAKNCSFRRSSQFSVLSAEPVRLD